jgi:histidinol dehydrogenase
VKIIENVDLNKLNKKVDAGTEEQHQTVRRILADVKKDGDEALYAYTARFDGAKLAQLAVTQEEIRTAYNRLEKQIVDDIRAAMEHIRFFHEKQKRTSWMTTSETGTTLGQLLRPLDRVGVYVPAGTAPLFSSLLMTVIPAQVAGVREIILTTPPDENGEIFPAMLVAADLLGIEHIYKVGGAQAVGAMAFGTASIPAVDKIVGPGNIYVALAKKEVFGLVDIDMIAGPSDVLVLAEAGQNPAYIAADLLSQAEHDPLSAAVCVTPSRTLAEQVRAEVEQQLATLPRRDIAASAISDESAIYVTESLAEAVDVVNAIAPEHLELLVDDPWPLLGRIRHAGAVFVGEYSSEPVGDYFAGPSHVLPTNGTARFSSGLNVDDFVKKSSLIAYSEEDFYRHGDKVMRLARHEGLEAHARAIQIRFDQEEREGKE